jgi:TrmH family RNA methyltransferase
MDQLFSGAALVVILDGLQEPGNAGTIIRTAEAFGATGLAALKNTVNLYNPKVVRASAGSLFRLPMVQGVDPKLLLATLQQHGAQAFAAIPHEGAAVDQAPFDDKCALVIGSEAHGVSAAMRAACQPVRIPTVGVESLNAAIAAAVLLYEARRRRGGVA